MLQKLRRKLLKCDWNVYRRTYLFYLQFCWKTCKRNDVLGKKNLYKNYKTQILKGLQGGLNLSCFCCHKLTLFKINFSKKIFQEHYQSALHFEPRPGPMFCRPWSGSKLFEKFISRQQKSSQAREELLQK